MGGPSRRDVLPCTVIQWRGRISHHRTVGSQETIGSGPIFRAYVNVFQWATYQWDHQVEYPCGATNSAVGSARGAVWCLQLRSVFTKAHAKEHASSSLKFRMRHCATAPNILTFLTYNSIFYYLFHRFFRDFYYLSRNITLHRMTYNV